MDIYYWDIVKNIINWNKFVARYLKIDKSNLWFGFIIVFITVFVFSGSINASTFSKFANVIPSQEQINSKDELVGMANPAAVYCNELNYRYRIDNEPRGQVGYCIFPNNNRCDEWQFLEGKCGQEWSYCAINGYDIITKSNTTTKTGINPFSRIIKTNRNPFSIEYAVCVAKDGTEIGSVTELMSLADLCLGCNEELK